MEEIAMCLLETSLTSECPHKINKKCPTEHCEYFTPILDNKYVLASLQIKDILSNFQMSLPEVDATLNMAKVMFIGRNNE
jgi:hypothetical protein